ncbi:MAG: gfo/Idh/MocA family oxidoreductase, partial [Chloroflexi bacterium]
MATARPVTLAILGTGHRGRTFSSFAQRYPDRARVVAVADPRTDRREMLADQLGVAADKRFDDWRDLAAQERLADAVIVTTPDREHVGPACRFA